MSVRPFLIFCGGLICSGQLRGETVVEGHSGSRHLRKHGIMI